MDTIEKDLDNGRKTELVAAMVAAAHTAGDVLLAGYDESSRPVDRAAMYELGMKLEDASTQAVRRTLDGRFTGVGWFDEDDQGREVPDGNWWIVDGTEGAVNHVHGLPEWGVTVALVTRGVPVAAVVRQPVGDLTYTATRRGGAFVNGRPLRVSAKTDLDAAIVAASQAGNNAEIYARFGAAYASLSEQVLLVRNTIPTTFPLLGVAGGHYDGFWQYDPDLPGTAVGTLLAAEAGAMVTDLSGDSWQVNADSVVVAAPGIHAQLLDVLRSVDAR